MRLHIIIAPLSENDDDMFPGISASALDDDTKAKDQSEMGVADLRWIKEQIDKYEKVEKVYRRKRVDIQNKMKTEGALNYNNLTNPGPNEVTYESFDWFENYSVLGISQTTTIDKSSPFFKDIENTVRILDMYYRREKFFRIKAHDLHKELNRIKRGQKKNLTDIWGRPKKP